MQVIVNTPENIGVSPEMRHSRPPNLVTYNINCSLYTSWAYNNIIANMYDIVNCMSSVNTPSDLFKFL